VLAILRNKASHWVDEIVGQQQADGEPLAFCRESRKHVDKVRAEIEWATLARVLWPRERRESVYLRCLFSMMPSCILHPASYAHGSTSRSSILIRAIGDSSHYLSRPSASRPFEGFEITTASHRNVSRSAMTELAAYLQVGPARYRCQAIMRLHQAAAYSHSLFCSVGNDCPFRLSAEQIRVDA